VDYRRHDQEIWEKIFREAPDEWLSAEPSELMRECASFLRKHGVRRALDLGSGFGRWTNFVADQAGCSVVGLDYALGGSRLGSRLAGSSSRSRFLAGEITALPFRDESFDGFIAVLILDCVAATEGAAAVREVSRVVQQSSPGFVVFNPWPMPDGEQVSENPTKNCTRRDYSDGEALGLLSRWEVLSWRRVEHGLRLFEVRIGL
jgi:ubiquinone/menaquinone biosynthesis C-methylase UbiE